MRHKKQTAILMILLLAILAVTGCSPDGTTTTPTTVATTTAATTTTTAATTTAAATAETTAAVIQITDMTGREIVLEGPAARVVALTASDCEILFAVGAGHTLVGRGEYCNYPAEALEAPTVQSGHETNIEQIIALEPQVVLMSTMAQTEEQIDALEKAGIRVVVSDAHNIEGVYTSIRLIGAVVGQAGAADTVVGDMKAIFDEMQEKVSGHSEKTIYFEVSPLEWGLWTAGSGTFMDELAGMLGLVNIFSDVTSWGEISQEQVIERNPDFIVTITMYYGEGPTPVEEIMGREGWQDMKAIRSKTVLNVDSDEISRPGPRLAEAMKVLYDFVYGN